MIHYKRAILGKDFYCMAFINIQRFYQSSFLMMLLSIILPLKVLSFNMLIPIEINSQKNALASIVLAHNNKNSLGWIEYVYAAPFASTPYLSRFSFSQLQVGDVYNQQGVGIGYGNLRSNGLLTKGYSYLDWMEIARSLPYQKVFHSAPYLSGTIGTELNYLFYTVNLNGHYRTHFSQHAIKPSPMTLDMKNLSSYLAMMSKISILKISILELNSVSLDCQVAYSYRKWIQPFIGAYYSHLNLIIPNISCDTLQDYNNASSLQLTDVPLDYTFLQGKDVIGVAVGIVFPLLEIKATFDTLKGLGGKVACKLNINFEATQPSQKTLPLRYRVPVCHISPLKPYYATTDLKTWNALEWHDCCAPAHNRLEIAKIIHSIMMRLDKNAFEDYAKKLNQISSQTLHDYHKIVEVLGNDHPWEKLLKRLQPFFNRKTKTSVPPSLIQFFQDISIIVDPEKAMQWDTLIRKIQAQFLLEAEETHPK